jgi:integrase
MPVYTRTYRLKNGETKTRRFIKFSFNGETYYPDTKGARTLSDFRQLEAQAYNDAVAGKLGRKQKPKLADFIKQEYLPWAKIHHKPSNYQSDRWRCDVLIAGLGKLRLDELTPFRIEQFKRERMQGTTKRGTTRAPASVNHEMAVLSKILSLACDHGQLETNPCRKVKKLRLNNRRHRYLTEAEEPRLLDACFGKRQHLRPLIRLALQTGMRRGELLKLTWRDIDLGRAVIHIRDPKNGRDRAIPMNDEARAVLDQLCPGRADDRLFPFDEIKRAWNTSCRIAGIEDLHFHDLRHTFATRLADAGADAFTIAALLGHTTIQMAARYTHATDQGKRSAVKNLENRCKIVATPKLAEVRKMFN